MGFDATGAEADGRFLTSAEASKVLGLVPLTLARYRHAGTGPAFYKFGSAVRYRLEDLRAWATTVRDKRTVRATPKKR